MLNWPSEMAARPTPQTIIGRMRQWLRDSLGVDRAIGYTVLGRGWRTASGLITVLLVARFLNPTEQGYYYTFSSLVALQIVFELGFSFVILQLASHERAHLSISADFTISGDAVAHGRLASVIQKSVRWYSIAAVLLMAGLLPAGFWLFSAHRQGVDRVAWQLPWCCAAVAAVLNFQLDPILSFFEGCGYVADVARVRLWQAMAGPLMAWGVLVLHLGLFAPAMIMAGTSLTTIVWFYGRRRFLFSLLTHRAGSNRIRWKQEVWPFQWRMAMSWICGYFIFQLFNPILFAFQGPIAAGQMGMSLSIVTALQAVAISWINTKSAPFGVAVALREYSMLDRLFFRTLKQSMAVQSACSVLLWLSVIYINSAIPHIAQRLLSPSVIAILLFATSANIVVFAQAIYIRSHKQEKFLANSIVTALLTGASTFISGKYFGASGMAIGYLTVVALVSLPIGTLTFLKYRRIWHAE